MCNFGSSIKNRWLNHWSVTYTVLLSWEFVECLVWCIQASITCCSKKTDTRRKINICQKCMQCNTVTIPGTIYQNLANCHTRHTVYMYTNSRLRNKHIVYYILAKCLHDLRANASAIFATDNLLPWHTLHHCKMASSFTANSI